MVPKTKKYALAFIFCSLCALCCSAAGSPDRRAEMRRLVEKISGYAKALHPGFAVFPQNGQELVTDSGNPDGKPDTAYLAAVDGTGREDMYYGYTADAVPTPGGVSAYFEGLCDVFKRAGKTVLAIDYCSGSAQAESSGAKNAARGYLGFAADHRLLDDIPFCPALPRDANSADIDSPGAARNFLYLIDPEGYPDKAAFIKALAATDYDIIIIDLYYKDEALSAADIARLRNKRRGGRRLLVAYMSIGEAEDYRYYWKDSWTKSPPSWLGPENPDWKGNYKVRYWDPAWQALLFGSSSSYLDRIVGAGFDGVYLDIVDAFEFWENKKN